jgi:predicted GIY-YIG superfamily endonuclease
MASARNTAATVSSISSRFDEVLKAIDREKQLKHWSRTKKIWLIERQNPTWDDLAAELFTKHMYQPDKQVPPLAS